MDKIKAILGEDGKPEIQAVLVSDNIDTKANNTRRIIRVNIVDSETTESTEEVDVYTTADAVYTNEETGETVLDYIDFRLKYTNTNPTPIDIGGYPRGTTFVDVDLKDVINGLLYPNTGSNVKLSVNKDTEALYERGVGIQPVEFSLQIQKTSSSAAQAQLMVNGVSAADFVNLPSGDGTVTLVYNGAVNDNYEFKALVTDASGNKTESNVIKFKFVDPIYAGIMASNAMTVTDGEVNTNFSKYLFDENTSGEIKVHIDNCSDQKVAFMLKNGIIVNKIMDSNRLDITNMFTDVVKNIKNGLNETISYNLWFTVSDTFTFTDMDFYLDINS